MSLIGREADNCYTTVTSGWLWRNCSEMSCAICLDLCLTYCPTGWCQSRSVSDVWPVGLGVNRPSLASLVPLSEPCAYHHSLLALQWMLST
ncbi:hypothetical protein PoB_000003400 [Plakobranchus ocellatus]|uniref:Uncharacterized protein n=1 Tax=Plakobranchus ocellatus TaxID=259542 RepID=A0AAV3XPC9_9GAST|nr:hypothetical protein PoB_000003400 [Plakobranchus ocellatus]